MRVGLVGFAFERGGPFACTGGLFVRLLLNETQRAGPTPHLPIVCRQLITPGLELMDSIAAFLIGQGEFCYYSASTGWFDRDWVWHAEFDTPFGRPLAPATDHGNGVFTRAYSGCDVTVNCTGAGRGNCKGTVMLRRNLSQGETTEPR